MALKDTTKKMISYLPSWMKIRKDETSIGAQFLDCFGFELQEINDYLNELLSDQYIGTADTGQPDIIYKHSLAALLNLDEYIDIVKGQASDDKVEYVIAIKDNLRDFYKAPEDSNVGLIDRDKKILYTRRKYDYIIFDGTKHWSLDEESYIHHVWNAFDEFGLLVDCPRLFNEKNAAYKERILDVFRKPANASKPGLINSISRNLGLDEADIKINTMNDTVFTDTLLNEDGTANDTFERYIKIMHERIPILLGSARWDEAYWDLVESEMMGINYLPHIWDVNLGNLEDSNFKSGVGSESDLRVGKPELISDTQEFNYYVGLKGIKEIEIETTPEVELRYSMQARGQVPTSIVQDERFYYTITAAENVSLNFNLQAYKTYSNVTDVTFGAGFTYDTSNNTRIIKGNTITNPSESEGQKLNYIKVIATLRTNNPEVTPKLHDVTLTYKDTLNAPVTTTLFTTEADFDATPQNAPYTWNATADGDLELARTSIGDDSVDWNEAGTTKVNVTVDNGALKLILP